MLTATNTIPTNNNIIFNNLTISGGTTTLSRNTTVNANLTIMSGGTLDGGVHTLSVGRAGHDGTFLGNTVNGHLHEERQSSHHRHRGEQFQSPESESGDEHREHPGGPLDQFQRS